MVRILLLAVTATLLIASPASAVPTWLPPSNLGAETTALQSTGRVALGADGTAVSAWAQNVGGTHVLQVARRKPGQGYGAAITVPGTTAIDNVRVGVDRSGNATILYRQGGALVVVPWPAASATPGATQPLEAGGSAELAVGRGGTSVATWIENPNSPTPSVRAAVRPGASGGFVVVANPISALGNGIDSITGLRVAVGDGGHAAVAWSRRNAVPQTLVEASTRDPGGNLTSGTSISEANSPSTQPAVAIDASGRATVLWTQGFQVKYAEHLPGAGVTWSDDAVASRSGVASSTPVAAAVPGGVVAAWVANGAMEAAARSGGGAFAGFRTLSGPSMDSFQPLIAAADNGDAVIAWLVGDGKALFNVQRKANGTFGPLLTAVSDAGQPPGEFRSFFDPSIGMDNQGNAVAAWTRSANRRINNVPTDHFRFQSGSFDAAPPTLNSSVPPGAQIGAPVGMAAAASDRVSPVAIAWNFGDGTTGTGGAVAHAFGSAGAFTVTVTATDAAGNRASRTHPVLIAAGPPPPEKRIRVPVTVNWAQQGDKVALVVMVARGVPKGTKAQVTCKGKKCPFKRKTSRKRRKGNITLFKRVSPVKALASKKRNVRGGQRIELRLTKSGFIGQVVRYKIKTGKIPVARNLCLPVGAKKPRRQC